MQSTAALLMPLFPYTTLLWLLGVHDCLVKSVMKADMDLRRVLFSQMVLSGGSTMFPGKNPKNYYYYFYYYYYNCYYNFYYYLVL